MYQIASQRIFIFKKFPGEHAPGPPRNLVAFGHLGLLHQIITTTTTTTTTSLFSETVRACMNSLAEMD